MFKRIGLWTFFLSILFGASPILIALSAGWIGAAADCTVNEAGANVCMVWGADIGGMLAYMFVMGWFGFYTIPLGILGALGGVLLFIIGLFADGKRTTQT